MTFLIKKKGNASMQLSFPKGKTFEVFYFSSHYETNTNSEAWETLAVLESRTQMQYHTMRSLLLEKGCSMGNWFSML